MGAWATWIVGSAAAATPVAPSAAVLRKVRLEGLAGLCELALAVFLRFMVAPPCISIASIRSPPLALARKENL
jgi:hypothetical protein